MKTGICGDLNNSKIGVLFFGVFLTSGKKG